MPLSPQIPSRRALGASHPRPLPRARRTLYALVFLGPLWKNRRSFEVPPPSAACDEARRTRGRDLRPCHRVLLSTLFRSDRPYADPSDGPGTPERRPPPIFRLHGAAAGRIPLRVVEHDVDAFPRTPIEVVCVRHRVGCNASAWQAVRFRFIVSGRAAVERRVVGSGGLEGRRPPCTGTG